MVKGWTKVKLSNISEIIPGQAPPSQYYNNEGNGMPFLKVNNFGFRYPNIDTWTTLSLRESTEDDVLISVAGSLGLINLGINASITRSIFALRPKNIKRDFLFYALKKHSKDFEVMGSGSAQKIITKPQLSNYFIDVPCSFDEQKEISAILRKIDNAIEETTNYLTKLWRLKSGFMYDLLNYGITKSGTIRNPEKEKFYNTEIGNLPNDWKCSTIGKECKICNHIRKPISAIEREKMQGDYPYYGPTGILDYINEYRGEGRYVLIGEDGDHFLKFRAQPMTILVEGKFNVNNHAHVLKGKENCLTKWIYYYFEHRDITVSLTRQGAGRLKLNKQSLSKLNIAIPTVEEQNRIIDVLCKYNERLTQEKKNLTKLKHIKVGLMQDLLTGKVRVNHMIKQEEVA